MAITAFSSPDVSVYQLVGKVDQPYTLCRVLADFIEFCHTEAPLRGYPGPLLVSWSVKVCQAYRILFCYKMSSPITMTALVCKAVFALTMSRSWEFQTRDFEEGHSSASAYSCSVTSIPRPRNRPREEENDERTVRRRLY